ncbi:hypothetical protein GCM10028822_08940 [Hymenobacter terrigena]
MSRFFSSKFLLAAGFVLLLPATAALAQTPATGGPTPEDPPAPINTPLDGGASLLLAGGVAYALKRLRRRKA